MMLHDDALYDDELIWCRGEETPWLLERPCLTEAMRCRQVNQSKNSKIHQFFSGFFPKRIHSTTLTMYFISAPPHQINAWIILSWRYHFLCSNHTSRNHKKMLESWPEDALCSLVENIETVCTPWTAESTRSLLLYDRTLHRWILRYLTLWICDISIIHRRRIMKYPTVFWATSETFNYKELLKYFGCNIVTFDRSVIPKCSWKAIWAVSLPFYNTNHMKHNILFQKVTLLYF